MNSEICTTLQGPAGQELAPRPRRAGAPHIHSPGLKAAVAETPMWTTTECARLLRMTGELYQLPNLSALPAQLLRCLRALLPHELGGCHLVEPSRHHIATFYEPALPTLPPSQLDPWQLSEMHPLGTVLFSQPFRAWRLSDIISLPALRETRIYQVLYGPLGLNYELVAALPDSARPGAFLLISLHRRREDFSDRERALLDLLMPQIAGARQRLCAAAARTPVVATEPVQFREWLQRRTQWELTPRETEVLFWLSQGKTNSEIGRILGIAERTAETHALRIYPKIGVENRYTAIATLTRLSVGQAD